MKVTSPREYLKAIDPQRLKQLLSKSGDVETKGEPSIEYVEPADTPGTNSKQTTSIDSDAKGDSTSESSMNEEINGKIQRLGDFIDTDAVSPSSELGFNPLTITTACTCAIFSHLQGQ